MPTPHRVHRLGATAALTALTLLSVAFPAGAAGKTRMVDDDGKASATSCDAGTAAYTSVQKAVNQSGPGDTVKVCPGTYLTKVLITGDRDGLKLLSTKAKGATIKDPSIYQVNPTALVRIEEVSGVTVKGFKVRTLSWSQYDTQSMDGILASGAANVTIRGNHVSWSGPAGDRSDLISGIVLKAGTTGSVIGNTIIDPLFDGIHATGAGTNVLIESNVIKALFAGNSYEADDAVEIREGARATVKLNTIEAAAGSTPILSKFAGGVDLNQAHANTVVRANTIASPVVGIVTRGNGYSLYNNDIVARQLGISLVTTDAGEVIGNKARATKAVGYGIFASEQSDNNQIHGNDVRGSFGADCYEDTSDADGIDNSWSENLHDDDSPNGLCDEDDVPA